jgi:uncharacterized protein
MTKGTSMSKLRDHPRAGAGVDREKIVATLRAHEPKLRRRGVRHAALFGSVARGESKRSGRCRQPKHLETACSADNRARRDLCLLIGHSRLLPELALLLQLPEAFAETGLQPMHGAKLFEHAALRVVETLHNRG